MTESSGPERISVVRPVSFYDPEDGEAPFDRPLVAEEHPELLGVFTTAWFPGWKPGDFKLSSIEVPENWDTVSPEEQKAFVKPFEEKTRGDSALKLLAAIKNRKHPLVVVDGGSSPEFCKAVKELDVTLIEQVGRGMSLSRLQALHALINLCPEVEGLVHTEIEKFDFVRSGGLALMAQLVLTGMEDIGVPARRLSEFWQSYPPGQFESEMGANRYWTMVIQAMGGRLPGSRRLYDSYFGPRVFANTPANRSLFFLNYGFVGSEGSIEPGKLGDFENPAMWSGATFLPLLNALNQGLRLGQVEVPYYHPAIQTALETHPVLADYYNGKRATQGKIVPTNIAFCRFLKGQGDPKIRLVPGAQVDFSKTWEENLEMIR